MTVKPQIFFCARFSPLEDSASRRPAVVKHRPHRPEERVIGTRVNPSTSAPLPPNAGNQPCQPLADGEGGHKSQYRINQLNRLPESWFFYGGGRRQCANACVLSLYGLAEDHRAKVLCPSHWEPIRSARTITIMLRRGKALQDHGSSLGLVAGKG